MSMPRSAPRARNRRFVREHRPDTERFADLEPDGVRVALEVFPIDLGFTGSDDAQRIGRPVRPP